MQSDTTPSLAPPERNAEQLQAQVQIDAWTDLHNLALDGTGLPIAELLSRAEAIAKRGLNGALATGNVTPLAERFRLLEDELARGVPKAIWSGLCGYSACGAITALGGFMGAGKTPFELRAIAAMLRGISYLGFEALPLPENFKIIYLTQESPYTFLPAVAEAGLADPAITRGRFEIGYFHDFATAEWPETVAAAAEKIAGNGLLVTDTIADWSRAAKENDNAIMTDALRPLVLTAATGAAVHFMAHTPKSFNDIRDDEASAAAIRGAGAIISNATLIFTYKVSKPKRGDSVRQLKMHRTRFDYEGMPSERYTEMQEGTLRQLTELEAAMRVGEGDADKLRRALLNAGGSAGLRELRRELHMDVYEMESAVTLIGAAVLGRGVSGDPKVVHLEDPTGTGEAAEADVPRPMSNHWSGD